MQFPKLTPLQSRLVASLAASLTLLILFFAFSRPQFAYAFSADSIEHRDHNHPFLLDLEACAVALDLEIDDEAPKHLSDIAESDQSLIGRAPDPPVIKSLSNNVPGQLNITLGGPTQFWSFPESELEGPLSSDNPILPQSDKLRRDDADLEGEDDEWQENNELRRRQNDDRTYYLTLNVCDQPSPTTSNPDGPPLPLQVHISHDPDNMYPGQNPNDGSYLEFATDGYFYYSTQTTRDVYVGVNAPTDPRFQGQYNYELTISIDKPYAAQEDFSNLHHLDSDSNAGLFVSNNLTDNNTNSAFGQAWMNSGSPFSIFVHDQNDVAFSGLKKSFCGLKKHAQIKGNVKSLNNTDVEAVMTTVGGGYPKEQLLVKNLNSSSQYYAIIALESNYSDSGSGHVNGGGTVWDAIPFSTQPANSNCQLLYNLDFCDGVNYAVPSNSSYAGNYNSLASTYDNYTQGLFQNFEYSLDQIPCNTTSSARYSLAVTCDNCTTAYKQWLCAVNIPRCTDFSSTGSYLQPRISQSRTLFINNTIKPGPYKEILPCESLCYGLVQNCPASLGFTCPSWYRNMSYGSVGSNTTNPECSIPGMIWGVSGSSTLRYNVVTFWGVVMIALGICISGVY